MATTKHAVRIYKFVACFPLISTVFLLVLNGIALLRTRFSPSPKSLQDSSREVRLTTLKILGFLILNDLIKVKGQMSHLALLVTDKDFELADMSKNLFMELGKKVCFT